MVRLPRWVPLEGRTRRLWAAVCCRADAGQFFVNPSLLEEVEGLAGLVLDAVRGAAMRLDVRPGRVVMTDPEVGRALAEALAPEGVAVEIQNELPALERALELVREELAPEDGIPGPLSEEDVTVEDVRAFARAAEEFYASGIWRLLTEDDFLAIEAPERGAHLRELFLWGRRSGRPRLFFLMDLPGEGDGGNWCIDFTPLWKAPQADAELWEQEGFPRMGEEELIAAAGFLDRDLAMAWRPDAGHLAFFEGLLRALAETAEGELDGGRWAKQVRTSRGMIDFVLSLPDLLEEGGFEEEEETEETVPGFGAGSLPIVAEKGMRNLRRLIRQNGLSSPEELEAFLEGLGGEIPSAEPETPEEQAEDLVDEARLAFGRRRILLARRALELWPDCADAYVVLGNEAATAEEALALCQRGVAAGERALGPEFFREDEGRFWGILETRPYMRARYGVAEALLALDRPEEAVPHLEDLLRLNPNDNQGVREDLVHALIGLGREEDAAALLERYAEDGSAVWAYARVLLAFRREGDSLGTRRELRNALKVNRFVPAYLLRRRPLPGELPDFYSLGGDDEAVLCASGAWEIWENTPGALEWLAERTATPVKQGKKRKGRGRKGKKKGRR
ncbi:MAG: tetratricopeptide repeat protein [Thermoanaerobaculia bacterium]